MEYTGIAYDSRKVKPGDVFVAIPGMQVNGEDFIPQAIGKGAQSIVAEKTVDVPEGISFQKVPSARRALAHLANEFYGHPSRKLKLIGITGTNGKTTTAYLVESILKKAGYKTGLIGTVTGTLTTPESLELQAMLAKMVEEKVTHVVMEVSSHALALERVYGCDFDIAVFTNLTHDHLDFHHTREEYLAIKKRLFESLKSEGAAIINVDDPASRSFIGAVRGEVITYGMGQAKHELRSTRHNAFDSRVSDIIIREKEMTLRINSMDIHTPLIGMHNAYNILAAYECGLALGVLPKTIIKGIEALKGVPGRVEQVECGQPFSVIVDFAHSPDSLQQLIETYRPLTQGRIILVFGCPGDRDKDKRPIMGKIAVELADQVIVTTDDPHSENPEAITQAIASGFLNVKCQMTNDKCREIIIDRKKAIQKALGMAKKGDTVLIAGRGHEKFQDFAGKKIPLDDREVVKKYFASARRGGL